MKHLTIAIDFDGTICDSKWPQCGEPIPGAIETIRKLHKQGHKVIIWTCRTGEPLIDAIQWLAQHRVPYDAINMNLPEKIKAFGGDTRKVSADLYVDDKGLGMRKVKGAALWTMVRREVNAMMLEAR
jgi:uncharacterized HAD superfamily protein